MNTLLLQAQGQGGGLSTLLMFGLIIMVMYFFMIRPQQKKQKELRKFRDSLEKGMRIITIGGIHGKIEEIKDSSVIISVEGGGKLRVERTAVSLDASSLLTEETAK
jgi:preprotein translocase subunit YajC